MLTTSDKDISTVKHEPQRLWRWAEIAMDVVGGCPPSPRGPPPSPPQSATEDRPPRRIRRESRYPK